MKCSFGISDFLEEISSLSHSVVFLYFFALIAEEGFPISSCYSLYAEYIMWNARLDDSQAGIKTTGRNINNLRYADDTTLRPQNEGEQKNLLRKVKKESEKAGLKLNIQKTKIMASGPITSWEIEGEKVEAMTDFIFLVSKITADGTAAMKLKDACTNHTVHEQSPKSLQMVIAAMKLKDAYSLEGKLWPTWTAY